MAARPICFLAFCMAFASFAACASEEYSSFEPRGIRMGRLLVTPSLEAEQAWTSNVYYEDNNVSDDFYATLRPQIKADIDLLPHHVTIDAGAAIARYRDETSENTEDRYIDVKTDLEIRRNLRAVIDAGYAYDHEDRTSTLSLNAPETPVEFSTRRVMTRMIYAPARLQLAVYGGYMDKSFEDNRVRGTGADNIQRDRDFTRWTGGARISYDISAKLEPYIDASHARVDYRRRDYIGGNAFDGIDRDRNEDRFKIGANFEAGRKWLGQIELGWGRNDPDDEADEAQNSWLADTNLTWLMTPLTSLTFGLNRSLEDDNDINQGYVMTRTSLDVRHELAENWVLGLALQNVWRNFQSSSRADETMSAGLSLSYTLNRYLALVADVQQAVRDSENGGVDYAQTLAFVRLKGQI